MDWLTFITKIVETLAWPVVVLLVAFGLRSKLAELIPFLRRLKYKDLEAEFGEGVRKVSENLPPAPVNEIASTNTPSPASTLREKILGIAELAPRAAVLESWLQVEHAAQRLVAKTGVADRSLRMVGPSIMRKYLDKTGVLTEQQKEGFEQLRDLRNKVVHFVDLSLPLDQVLEYIDLALSLAAQLDAAAEKS